MRRIALEEHFVINDPEHVERWLSLAAVVPKAVAEKILPVLADVGERRLEAMTQAGIDVAVLSNVGSVQGILDATIALRLAQQANDYLALTVQRHPKRYAGFATVPLQDPTVGANELERAVRQLGLRGAMVFGHTNGAYLDHDRFRPFWERAEALGVPVYLHAADAPVLPPSYAGRPELLGPIWSWTAETATHALRLVLGGVFERFPRLRVVLGHMGETLPFMLWRLDRRAEAFSTDATQRIKPSALVRRNIAITTAGMCSDAALRCAIDSMGLENVMFSVDHPFESMEASSAWLNAAPLPQAARDDLSWRNAQKLLRL